MKLLGQLCLRCSVTKSLRLRVVYLTKIAEQKHRILSLLQQDFSNDFEDGPWEAEYVEMRYLFEQMDIGCFQCEGAEAVISQMVDEYMIEKLHEVNNDEAELDEIETGVRPVAKVISMSKERRKRESKR
ncbi:MAG: hypothetical protein WCG01_03190 [bacterium]